MAKLFKKRHLRTKAHHCVEVIEAILYLTNHMTADSYAEIAEARKRISKISYAELRKLASQLEKTLDRCKETYGVRVEDSELIEFVQKSKATPKGKNSLVPIYVLREMFHKYPIKDEDVFPVHARIVITMDIREPTDTRGEVYLLETILFEDMCMLFNQAKKAIDETKASKTKLNTKKERALNSATLISVYDFVEAYLNGIATDYYFANKDNLDDRTKSTLTEGQRTFRFREKLLQYPKIILGTKHPPFQENNCPEIEFLTGHSKQHRDAIVHATAIPDPKTFDPVRETLFFNLDFEVVQEAVDSAIALVRKIENCIRGDCKRITWMKDRTEDGVFPDSTFD